MHFERASGVLLPVTALPSGRLGADALKFVDWLADAGQRWWQILPFGPPDRYRSPYSSASAFAGSPTWIAKPDARVTAAEIDDFVASQPWAADWAAFAGSGALADQVRFTREWTRVREHAAARGVRILGDMAFAVAAGSADHRSHPELFRRGYVGGVPPDDWSADGQLWGTPVYDWAELARQGDRWWIERFRRAFDLVDALRVDHFRGFVAAWLVPERNRTARSGHWARGPGRRVFDAAREELGELPIVAENLGLITPAVERLRHDLGLPGSVVLQFAFGGALVNPQRVEVSADDVVYTGTHDNDTTVGWWSGASEAERAAVRRAVGRLGIDEAEPHWMLVRIALESRGAISLLPMQDLLGLGRDARMNTPGRATGNWRWRLRPDQLTPALAARLRDATAAAGRLAPEQARGQRRK